MGTTWGLIRADRAWKAEADRAEGERKANAQAQKRLQQIEKGSEILASVFTDLDPAAEEKEGKPLRAILGDRLAQAAEQIEGEAVGDPLLVADLQYRLGLSLLHLGLPQAGDPALRKARATRATSLGADHPDTLDSMSNLARGLHEAGEARTRPCRSWRRPTRLMKARLGARRSATPSSCMNNLATGYLDDGQAGPGPAALRGDPQAAEGQAGPATIPTPSTA